MILSLLGYVGSMMQMGLEKPFGRSMRTQFIRLNLVISTSPSLILPSSLSISELRSVQELIYPTTLPYPKVSPVAIQSTHFEPLSPRGLYPIQKADTTTEEFANTLSC